ncbi:unnamed protein product [Bursaphelenchus okinawaensis]|uniref:Saposin B-type domain-containing protein n=1 Tax=Bursaphelenchus okinawaensis TaxID=465554 RepID=A0A811KJQ0_9BILA|nr:unnamed protein product [Bursaphelenchus okinawaensis]CAG9104724.1 unnamed protein product [Bursaphelenchus okinawaensis]
MMWVGRQIGFRSRVYLDWENCKAKFEFILSTPNIIIMYKSWLVVIVTVLLTVGDVGAAKNDIMSCVLCQVVAESLMQPHASPAMLLADMYQRCGRVGLMEPVCDHLVDQNAKRMVQVFSHAGPASRPLPRVICSKLQLCDHS